ncbi:aspartate kinase [Clostridium tarantellae]|uniref:Aspartokinase n=1 Tax=Clostridium tarantellae TaxID=39493 RepID=A0A6I1MN52_9CLOT|nr:aspartate kinase [Clostridium tarantellae]MPQ43672.1 aspartate kinase [Clostridium tarantellae]
MKIIIQKFGGTSVSTKKRREMVVSKVKEAITQGYFPVVVVSAMGRKGEPYATDTLLSLVEDSFKTHNILATDLLMCCGEMISTVVISNELYNNNIEAIPMTGGQAGILTDDNYSSAKLIDVNSKKLLQILSQGKIPVVAGFQGVDREGFFTTLGRGGSDTTAAILGVALKAEEIQIYTDVDGIMTADPRIVDEAELINKISYNEVFQLADHGAKVIHPRAVEIAMRGGIPLIIKNTMSSCIGTLIDNLGDLNNNKFITGITHQPGRIQVYIKQEDNKNNIAYKNILEILAKRNISLDLINIFPKEKVFTIHKDVKNVFEEIMETNKLKYKLIEELSTIAIVGSRIKGIPGIMARIVSALDKENIEVLQTADSHMTIWCLVESSKVQLAIQLLHRAFMET